MRAAEERLFYAAIGPIAALALGCAMTPLREVAAASALTYPFILLTIVAGELGGHGAAVATALSSTLFQDFFLTKPYLHLSFGDKHDVMTFLGLCACGIVAAALGERRIRAAVGDRLSAGSGR